ncbi:MAG: transcriptional regulator [Caulobacteraceae bacterium]|nr:MAG: transcriptional regulator [Caulobacteraceae bacterium]
MDRQAVVASLSALAHEGRLDIFRLLVKAGPQGTPAGEIARRLAVMPNALSANLKVLSHAGLIGSRRQGRSIIYRANYSAMTDVLGFLMEDCCGGDAAICGPLVEIANRAACCAEPPGL